MQVNGKNADTNQVAKHFQGLYRGYTYSTPTYGSCESVDWGKSYNWTTEDYDGVTAKIWKQIPVEDFKGVGHWFLKSGDRKYYCVQVKGDKVGDEKVTKHFKDEKSLRSFTDSKLSKGSCESVSWCKKYDWSDDYDGVNGTLWTQCTAEEKKAEAEKAAAAKKA